MKRLNKEYEIKISDKIKTKYGSVNRIMPIVIYVTCKNWITPKVNYIYSEQLKYIFKTFKRDLKRLLINSPYFENKLMCDFDLKINSLEENKKNFFSFEFFIKQKSNIIQLSDIGTIIENLIKPPIDNLILNLNNDNFILTKSK